MKKQLQFRQGDVWIERVDEIPADAKLVQTGGMIILAHGEATGHHHSIHSKTVSLHEAGVDRYISIPRAATLMHQEHAPVKLPAGNYRVKRQREYSPEAIRNVAD